MAWLMLGGVAWLMLGGVAWLMLGGMAWLMLGGMAWLMLGGMAWLMLGDQLVCGRREPCQAAEALAGHDHEAEKRYVPRIPS